VSSAFTEFHCTLLTVNRLTSPPKSLICS